MADWDAMPLGEVCTIKPPKSEARAKLAAGDEVSFAPMEDLGIGVKYLQPHRTRPLGQVSGSYTYFADGDVLLAKITPCFENGKLGVARGLTNGVGFGSSEYIVLRPSPTLDAEFLYYYLARPAFLEEGTRTMTGAVGHKRVTKEFVESYPIPLPPLGEQRRIVTILDEAFEGIATAKANAERNLQNARDVLSASKRDVFRSLISKFGIDHLGAICDFENGDRGKNYPGKQHRVAHGVPFINAGHLDEEGLDFTAMDYISTERFNLLGNGKIRPGDILFCLRGSLGKFASVGDLARGAIASSLVILRPTQRLDTDFLLAFLSSHQCADQIELLKGGAAQPNLGAKDLKRFEIPLPPLPAQRAVADQMLELQMQTRMVESIYQRKLTALDELKQSLLHQAFSGQL